MKKIRYIILTILLLFPTMLSALEIDGLYSKYAIIYNRDNGEILYEKDSDTKTSIASLTKIMTTLVALENIKDLDKEITITNEMLEEVPWDASVAGLKVGDTVTYKDLLYAVLLPSGADATDSLAIDLFGSIDLFVEKMNDKAKELKLENTHFVNTTGYDAKNHYSTAKDILSLLNYALENETFKEIYETRSYTLTNGLKVKSTLETSNRTYDYDLSFVKGSKTGYTDDAGVCLSALSDYNGTDIITITINAPYEYGRSRNLEDLMTIHDVLLDKYDTLNLVTKGETLKTLKTKYAKEKEIEIIANKDIKRYVEKDYDKDLLEIKYIGEETVRNTTKKGTKIGKFEIYFDKELIGTIDALTKNNLTFSIWEYIKTNIIYYVILLVLIIGTFKLMKKPKKRKIRR